MLDWLMKLLFGMGELIELCFPSLPKGSGFFLVLLFGLAFIKAIVGDVARGTSISTTSSTPVSEIGYGTGAGTSGTPSLPSGGADAAQDSYDAGAGGADGGD
jgi:hypothetical protein